MQSSFYKTATSNSTEFNVSSRIDLQLQMLEEEKEIQSQYLEKKSGILYQGGSTWFSSFPDYKFSLRRPISEQIAVKQLIPKELPTFGGNPEDWPLLISSYKNTILMRLQSCLQGRAKANY